MCCPTVDIPFFDVVKLGLLKFVCSHPDFFKYDDYILRENRNLKRIVGNENHHRDKRFQLQQPLLERVQSVQF